MKMTFAEKVEKKLGELSAALNSNNVLQIIRDAMLAYVPVTIITGLFLILAFFPVQGVVDFFCGIFGIDNGTWISTLTMLYNVGLGIGGFLVLLTASIAAAKKLGIDVEATTFHKLGLDIIKAARNYRPDINEGLDSFVANYFRRLKMKKRLINPYHIGKISR